MSHITPKTIDSCFPDPEFHSIDHSVLFRSAMMIKLDDILPVKRRPEPARAVTFIKLRVFFCPGMVPGGMIGHPVDQHFKSNSMSLFYQSFKIVHCSEFRINGFMIFYRIITAQASDPFYLANGMNGHEPQSLHSHFF